MAQAEVDRFDVADNMLQELTTDPELDTTDYCLLANYIHILIEDYGTVFTAALQEAIVQDKAPATIASLPAYILMRKLLHGA